MRFFGGLIVALGILSAAVSFLNMHFIFLKWIESWGPGIAWAIRGGMVVIGLVMYIAGKPSEEE